MIENYIPIAFSYYYRSSVLKNNLPILSKFSENAIHP